MVKLKTMFVQVIYKMQQPPNILHHCAFGFFQNLQKLQT